MRAVSSSIKSGEARSLAGFLAVYSMLYCGFGAESAYLPAFLLDHGLPVERIGLVLAAGTAVRMAAGPAMGQWADASGARVRVFTIAALASSGVGLMYLGAFGLIPLLVVGLAHAAVTAGLAPLADALALLSARFPYGWVRGAGSAGFVLGTLVSGQAIDRLGLGFIIVASSILFAVCALCAVRIEEPRGQSKPTQAFTSGGVAVLLRIADFRRIVLVAVLIIGSHALNDAFAVITWRAAGLDGGAVSLLWSESVAAEIAVFAFLGPWLLARIGPARAAAISAVAGIVRWGVMAFTTAIPALVCVQALHGLTFALMHLAAMAVIARVVPGALMATAQTVYGVFALGAASVLFTLTSGYLYQTFGAPAFFVMAALCALALPLTPGLGRGLDTQRRAQ